MTAPDLEGAIIRELQASITGWPVEPIVAAVQRRWIANPVQVVDALGDLVRRGAVRYDSASKLYALEAQSKG